MKNFRQFIGEPEPIRFAQDPHHNITMIFGANGAGKTTLLNAFTWLLYNQTTPAFADPEKIVSQRALAEAKPGNAVEASVSLDFEHNGTRYMATRRHVVQRGEGGSQRTIQDGVLEVEAFTPAGDSRRPGNPSDTLQSILPAELHNFFFFDGERIEHLLRDRKHAEIGDAIRRLLGLEILERGADHLSGPVRSQLRSELAKHSTTDRQLLLGKVSELEEKIRRLGDKKEIAQQNRQAEFNLKAEIAERLRKREDTQAIQDRIDRLDNGMAIARGRLQNLEREIQTTLSRRGFTVFLPKIVGKAAQLIEEKRKVGQIPSGIKVQFVDDLLMREQCICSTALLDGTNERREVQAWKARAGSTDVEEAATKVGVQLQGYHESAEGVQDHVTRFLKEWDSENASLRDLQERHSEAVSEIGSKDVEEVKQLAERQQRAEESVIRFSVDVKECERLIDQATQDLKNQQEELDAVEARSVEETLWQRRAAAAAEAAGFLKNLLGHWEDRVRRDLEGRVRAVYRQISYKDYYPELTEDFRLVLRSGQSSKDEVSMGTGEKQILSLSFIASIADYARDRAARGPEGGLDLGFEGGLYPLVMDSPFGNLDDNYRKGISEGLPSLAEQVIVFASKSQGQGIVWDNLRARVDKAYVIQFSTTKEDQSPESIFIDNEEFPYIMRSEDGHEAATLAEVQL